MRAVRVCVRVYLCAIGLSVQCNAISMGAQRAHAFVYNGLELERIAKRKMNIKTEFRENRTRNAQSDTNRTRQTKTAATTTKNETNQCTQRANDNQKRMA